MTPFFPDLTAWVEARGGDLSGVQIRDAATIPPARPGASVRRGRGLFATRAVIRDWTKNEKCWVATSTRSSSRKTWRKGGPRPWSDGLAFAAA